MWKWRLRLGKVDAAQEDLDILDSKISEIDMAIGDTNTELKMRSDALYIIEKELDGDEEAQGEKEIAGLRSVMEQNMEDYPSETSVAMEEYNEFLLTRDEKKAALSPKTIEGYVTDRNKAESALRIAQGEYGYIYRKLGEGPEHINEYFSRKERIEVKDLEEAISLHKLRKSRCFDIFNNEFLLTIRSQVNSSKSEVRKLNEALKNLGFPATYKIEIREKQDGSYFDMVLRQSNKQALKGNAMLEGQMDILDDVQLDGSDYLTEKEMSSLIEKILSEDDFEEYEDYRNYLTYDVTVKGNGYAEGTSLSRQDGDNSGAERQIPYTVILTCGLLNMYNKRKNSARLLFMDEPFEKLDAKNISIALDFFNQHNLQVLFIAGNKTGEIGEKCDVIVPVINKGDKTDVRFGLVERVA